jgi:type II secretory ATPase GspE/PulE/Tfp pilus assembly ATPase PilB-like protein
MERIVQALHLPWGMIICTGPTGSGKTTTLYACLDRITGPKRKVMSVEDPVEYILPWVTQVPLRSDAGVTFGRALRSFLRSDPDVIMVGEIRDLETIQICIQAALTGHLVMSTLHTDEAVGALRRLQDMGVDPYLVGSTVKLVIAQRLIRKLCPDCSVREMPGASTLAEARDRATAGGLKWDTLPQGFMKPVGCNTCVKTGYRGRTVISETLEMTPRIEQALRAREPDPVLREIAVREGMITMGADGVGRFADGETSFSEVARLLSWQ